jgi:hypothetical protein
MPLIETKFCCVGTYPPLSRDTTGLNRYSIGQLQYVIASAGSGHDALPADELLSLLKVERQGAVTSSLPEGKEPLRRQEV